MLSFLVVLIICAVVIACFVTAVIIIVSFVVKLFNGGNTSSGYPSEIYHDLFF